MKRYLIFAFISLFALTGLGVYQYVYLNDGRLHVVFCDVGQGDAIFIRLPKEKLVLIDGGPDKSVLSCLANHMGFWEHTFNLVLLTHPHQDHFFGLHSVIDRYITLSFDTQSIINTSSSYIEFIRNISNKKIHRRTLYAGDRYILGDGISMSIEAPSKLYLNQASPNGKIGETAELASLVIKLTFKDFDVLFTGDAQTPVLEQVAKEIKDSIDVLQVPHHGSATGLSKDFLERINPKLAIISVGKKNTYGLPNKSVLDILEEGKVKYLRTDKRGDVEIVSDGKRWWVR